MLVRLTKKLAEVINGVDVSHWAEGDLIDLPDADAQMLIAERWAEPLAEEGRPIPSPNWHRDARAVAADRGRHSGSVGADDGTLPADEPTGADKPPSELQRLRRGLANLIGR